MYTKVGVAKGTKGLLSQAKFYLAGQPQHHGFPPFVVCTVYQSNVTALEETLFLKFL